MAHLSRPDTALIDATVMDDPVAMRQALSEGANVNARDAEHQATPLMFASSEAAARLLLECGTEIDARNDRGATALMVQCLVSPRKRGLNIWRLLVEWGASVNARNEDGETVLHWAVISAKSDLVESLLALGAVPQVFDFETAVAMGLVAIASRLRVALGVTEEASRS